MQLLVLPLGRIIPFLFEPLLEQGSNLGSISRNIVVDANDSGIGFRSSVCIKVAQMGFGIGWAVQLNECRGG